MSLTWDSTGAWLLHVLVGGGLLLLLGGLLMRFTRQPACRAWLGDWAVTAALFLAVACLGPTWLVLNGGALVPRTTQQMEAGPVRQLELTVIPADVLLPVAVGEEMPWQPAVEEAVVAITDPPQELAPASAASFNPAMLLPWLFGAYLAVGSLLLARWLCGHLALARILRQAHPAGSGLERLFRRIAGHDGAARLVISPRVQVPLSCGLRRPTVVLPTAMALDADVQRLRWVFAHELTHLERRDALSGLLFGLAQGLFWGLPWFWWLRRQVRLCQEYVADAAAADCAEPAADYAEFLLSLTGAPAVSLAATGVSGSGSDLFRRISMLLQSPLRVEKNAPRRWSLAVAGGLLALAVVAAGIGVRAEAADPPIIIIIGGQDKDAKLPADKVKAIGGKDGILFLQRTPGQPEGVLRPVQPGPKVERLVPPAGAHRDVDVIVDWLIQEPKKTPAPGQQPGRGADIDAVRKILEEMAQHKAAELKEIRQALEQIRAARGQKIEGFVPRNFEFEIKPLAPGKTPGAPQQQFHYEIKPLAPGTVHPGVPAPPPVQGERGQRAEAADKLMHARQVLKELQKHLMGMGHEEAARELQKAIMQLEAQLPPRTSPTPVTPPAPRQEQAWGIWPKPAAVPMGHDPYTAGVRTVGPALGLKLEAPGGLLADQLNLPKGHGLVVIVIEKGSPGEKAGFRVNDVLLKLNTHDIPADPAALGNLFRRIGENEPARIAVLRKGKPAVVELELPDHHGANLGQKTTVKLPAGQGQSNTSTFRDGDRFSARHQEGKVTILVTGTGAGDNMRIQAVVVQDGAAMHAYDSMDAVPETYRPRVRALVEQSARPPVALPKGAGR